MKRIAFWLCVLVAVMLYASLGWAEVIIKASDVAKEEKKAQCPKTLYTEEARCSTCHIPPTFKLKEADPDSLRDYPIGGLRVRGEGNEQYGWFRIYDIHSEEIQRIYDYLNRHNIKKMIWEIHSPGGSLFEVYRIIGLMKYHELENGIVNECRLHGFGASAGFLFFEAATDGHRIVSSTCEGMWHELLSFSMFKLTTPSSSEDEAVVMRHLQDTAQTWLASKCKLTKDELDKLIHKKEAWWNGCQLYELGFADRVIGFCPAEEKGE